MRKASDVRNMDESTELSEGEVVEESSGNPSDENGSKRLEADTSSSREDGEEPKAKKQRHEESHDGEEPEVKKQKHKESKDGGEWQTPTPRQLKKMMKKKRREKRKHQELEDKYASTMATAQSSSSTSLNARQTDVLRSLVRIASGEVTNRATVQKLKTALFQNVISHLVMGHPLLSEPLDGLDELKSDYRIVVIWLSMISADYFKNSPDHFPKVKSLSPCVVFDIEHPGSSRFVKLGLESFMMLPTSEDNPLPTPPTSDAKPPEYWEYLLSLDQLTDNDFPNPSQGNNDQLGRHVEEYVSVIDWPSTSEITATPQVSAVREGTEEMPMFAIDCEMVETENGSELARVSIVSDALECVYDEYVKPGCPVRDYRTRYSGISKSTLEGVTTTLKEVQEKLPTLIPSNSILIGHSLENDFHAMKFKHPFVIDTSLIFTSLATPTNKPGLRRLSKELLVADIQNTEKGHDSVEDATTCMKLVQLKLRDGAACKISFNEITPSIFTEYRTHGATTGIVDKDSVVRLFGKGSTHSVEVKTDKEAVKESIKMIPLSKFTFIQFHDMENLLKSSVTLDDEKRLEMANVMDDHVIQVVENCPPKTVLFITCGSSDIRKVRSLQQQEYVDFLQLKKQVMLARTGCVVGLLVN